MKWIVCPLCKTKVVVRNDNRCPACRRDVTDEEAIRREQRLDEIYGLLWEFHQDGKSLHDGLHAVRCDTTFNREEIDEAGEAFLKEGRRIFLDRGCHHLAIGLLALLGGIAATVVSLVVPLPIAFVFYSAVAYGLVDSLFGLSRLIKYRRYFVL